jgi:hypothetical protein
MRLELGQVGIKMKKNKILILCVSFIFLSLNSCQDNIKELDIFFIKNKTDLYNVLYKDKNISYVNTYHRSKLSYIKLGNNIILFRGMKNDSIICFQFELENQESISRKIKSKKTLNNMMCSENPILQKTMIFFSDIEFSSPYYQMFFHDYILCKYNSSEIDIINLKNGVYLHKKAEGVIYDAIYLPDEEEIRFISFINSTKMDYQLGLLPSDVNLHKFDLNTGDYEVKETNEMRMRIDKKTSIEYEWYPEGKQIANLVMDSIIVKDIKFLLLY